MARCALLLLVSLARPDDSWAQLVIDPTSAEFQASSSHSEIDQNGVPIVDHYELEFFLIGAAQPFQVQPFGKPTPQSNGLITVSLASILAAFPSPGIVYDSTVAAVGPGGAARSTHSNTFQFSGPACTFSVSPTSRTLTAAGGASTTAVTATSNAPWVSISGGASGSGNGTVTFNAATNAQRIGTLTVAGQTVTVTQSGSACTFGISPTTRTVPAAGGNSSTLVTVTGGGSSCGWTATSNATWLTITSGPTGTGSATVTFSAVANTTTSQRVGTLTVTGRTLTVTQGAGTASGPSVPTNLRIVPTGQ